MLSEGFKLGLMTLLIILDSAVETRNIAAPTNTPDYAKNDLIINKVTTSFLATPFVSLDTTLFTISTAESRFINGKTREQQELQTLVRLRELAVKHKVALINQLL